jgi:hypothetical protein
MILPYLEGPATICILMAKTSSNGRNPHQMLKFLIVIVLIIATSSCFGQFAIVMDPDGYVNVRQKPDLSSKIQDSLHNGHFVYCMEAKGNWLNVDYDKNAQDLNGYLYRDRLKFISTYESIPLTIGDSMAGPIFSKDSITITVAIQMVAQGKYHYSYSKQNPTQIELIDGKQYWGMDGEAPTKEYCSIIIHLGARTIELPRVALSNLFEPSAYHTKINYDRQNDILYISSENSDGAGGYSVVWRVEKGEYSNRYITHGF